MYKVVVIEGKKIPMKSTGRTARLYSQYFHKDFLSTVFGLLKLKKGEITDTNIFDELSWVLAKTANENIPDIDEWLEQFDSPMSIFMKSQEIFGLINKSFTTTINPKKKKKRTKM